ncbi:GTP-binding protein GEM [Merluccius polli]|uniref:GTP-binding protein GEM n=1 Tax=Merluccius polli TaxID=89951 RepID=A0AA47P7T9_MERPO|nr:GTP-binding protein GEM [Merluccius polli]
MDRRRGSAPFFPGAAPQPAPPQHAGGRPRPARLLRARAARTSCPTCCAAPPPTTPTPTPPTPPPPYSSPPPRPRRPGGGDQRDCRVSDSSDSVISSGSESAEGQAVYKVVLLGEHGVGKSSLARIFGGVEEAHDAEEAGNTYGSDRTYSPWLKEQCMKMGDRLHHRLLRDGQVELREGVGAAHTAAPGPRQSENIPIILVGNKSDLVRSREVSKDGELKSHRAARAPWSSTASSSRRRHRCTHNVLDLFQGIVRQIRLRRKEHQGGERRRMANCKRRGEHQQEGQALSGTHWSHAKNKKMAFRQKSKSCHDLSVL